MWCYNMRQMIIGLLFYLLFFPSIFHFANAKNKPFLILPNGLRRYKAFVLRCVSVYFCVSKMYACIWLLLFSLWVYAFFSRSGDHLFRSFFTFYIPPFFLSYVCLCLSVSSYLFVCYSV